MLRATSWLCMEATFIDISIAISPFFPKTDSASFGLIHTSFQQPMKQI